MDSTLQRFARFALLLHASCYMILYMLWQKGFLKPVIDYLYRLLSSACYRTGCRFCCSKMIVIYS